MTSSSSIRRRRGYITLSCLYAAVTGVVITISRDDGLCLRSPSGFGCSRASMAISGRGATLNHDFIRFLLTRFNPNGSPQKMLAGVLRSCLGDCICRRTKAWSAASVRFVARFTSLSRAASAKRSRCGEPKEHRAA